MNHNWNWDSERAVSAVEQFAAEHGRLPVAKEMKRENGLPSRRTFEMKVGVSFYEYGKRYHPKLVKLSEIRHRQHIADSMRDKTVWTKETLVAAVKNFIDLHNRLPDIQEYTSKNGLPSRATFCRIAEAALIEYLEEYFSEPTQTISPKEGDTDAIKQDNPYPGMTLT